jgi:thermitase
LHHQHLDSIHRIARAVIAAVPLALLAACGGSSLVPATPHQGAQVVSGFTGAKQPLRAEAPGVQAQLDAEWQATLADPGTPGVDYDPTHITVFFKPGLRQTSAVGVDAGQAAAFAASQPNAILRANKQYESVAGAIALKYNLGLRTQAYIDDCNFAGFSLSAGADGAAVLAGIRSQFADSIEWATYSRLLRQCYSVNDPDYNNSSTTGGPLWGHRRIRVGEAWDYTRGSASVRIAVVDTGILITHEELALRVLNPMTAFPSAKCDLANNDNTMEDYDGHGTFIAGLICAQGNNNRTLVGVAHDCEVIPVKIANGGTAGDDLLASGCLLGGQLGAKVVNLSWGGYGGHPLLQSMVNTLVGNGVLFVGAAGNDASTDHHYPSDYANAVSVGWTYTSDERTQYPNGEGGYGGSNYGDAVDICAPGEELKSCSRDSDNAYSEHGAGTSFAAPIVAAAAGLLYTIEPSLTITEIRALLEDTGAPTTGFSATNPPKRLDIAAAMKELGRVKVIAPAVDKLIYQGSIIIQPTVNGTPDRVEYLLNNTLVATAAAAPWGMEVDLSSIDFGLATVQIHAVQGADTSDAFMTLLVDNSTGSYPVVERFNQFQHRNFVGLDLRMYPEAIVTAIKQQDHSRWTYANVTGNGPAYWTETESNPYSAPYAMYCGLPDSTYGNYETDALISRRIDLTNATNPTLVFQQRYNIQDGGHASDKCWVLVSEDSGLTWARAKQEDTSDAYWSGYQDAWDQARVNLAPYAGKRIHIALLMETNRQDYGENASSAAGWWVDDAVVAMNYLSSVPTLGSVSVAPYTLLGDVPAVLSLPVSVSNPQDVNEVTYRLDLAPLGVDGPEDVVVPADNAPFSGSIMLDAASGEANQLAMLRVEYSSSGGVSGPEIAIPVWIFNHYGDVNADGLVDQADFDAYPAKIGLASGDAGYVPFFDTNLDGVINEVDACSVGYNWGS